MGDKKSILIKNANVFAENGLISNGSILLSNGKIAGIYAKDEPIPNEQAFVIDGYNLNVIPGFIDGHIHGVNGVDVMDATEETLQTISQALPREGTTSFLATTMTQSETKISCALESIANYNNVPGQAEMIGVHLEGPFIDQSKAGAQRREYIIAPNVEKFKVWQEVSGHRIKTVTLAPEHDVDGSFIRYLVDSQINVSAGHTCIGFNEMKEVVLRGVRQVTHLCNAMKGIHHRDIGLVGAAFQLSEIRGELIADGIHVVPEMLQLIYDNMGSERIILITDSMRAKGLPDGNYELGGQQVKVSSGRALLEDGTLAGSVLKMNDAVKQMLRLNGVTINSIIEMASMNPAKQINMYDKKGSISVGKDADILLVDDFMNIKYTICNGVIAYEGE